MVTQTPNSLKQPPDQPFSAPQREQQPIMGAQASEYISPSEPEPTLRPEVAEAGVEVLPNTPQLTQTHTDVGIEHAKEAVLPHTDPSGMVQLPTRIEAEMLAKGNPADSKTWWGVELLKYIKKTLL